MLLSNYNLNKFFACGPFIIFVSLRNSNTTTPSQSSSAVLASQTPSVVDSSDRCDYDTLPRKGDLAEDNDADDYDNLPPKTGH